MRISPGKGYSTNPNQSKFRFHLEQDKKAPNVRFVVHKDRDYIANDDIEHMRVALAAHNIHLFVTGPSDVEGLYLSGQHIAHLNPAITQVQAEAKIVEARDAIAAKSKEAIVNLRTQEAFRKRNQGGNSPNHGAIAGVAHQDYDANPGQMMRGKLVLNRLKDLLQQELGGHAVLLGASPFLDNPELRAIAVGIWPPDP